MNDYNSKLKDPRWQKKRLKILERDSWACRKCGETTKTLSVHHGSYTEDPWMTPDNQLITLCCDCHTKGMKSVQSVLSEDSWHECKRCGFPVKNGVKPICRDPKCAEVCCAE